MSPLVKPIPIDSEQALEQLILAEPDNLEEGLTVLDNQVAAGAGFIDILAVDATEKSLVIIELKREESDLILVQTLQYYDFVRENIERFVDAYQHNHDIDPTAEPRIILVAHAFSESLQLAAKYVNTTISLYQYEYLQIGDQKGLLFTETPVLSPREYKRRRKTVQEHLDYIQEETSHKLCVTLIERIENMAPSHITKKGLRERISLKYDGQNLVDIRPRREYFYINWRGHGKDNVKIEDNEDLSNEIYDGIQSAIEELAAKSE